MIEVYDERSCSLGEGPLWHPERKQLFWFDINGKKLLTRDADGAREWAFDEHVSAGGWIDADTLLVASESSLFTFNLETASQNFVCALEAGNPVTRSNDGRADPWGGFWIGTMGKAKEPGAGAIYRYYRGELRCLYDTINVSNAICFSPDRRFACFADTDTHLIRKQELRESDGWPVGDPTVHIDLRAEKLRPDGAVMDSEGRIWNAQYGAGQVACYDAEGRLERTFAVPASQTTCPAFGGDTLSTLYVTTASQNLSEAQVGEQPDAGRTFVIETEAQGQPEHRVVL